MPPRLFVVLAALRLAVAGYAVSAVPAPRPGPETSGDWSGLERTTITANPKGDELLLELPPVTCRRAPSWTSRRRLASSQ